jgi:hypothetical protein
VAQAPERKENLERSVKATRFKPTLRTFTLRENRLRPLSQYSLVQADEHDAPQTPQALDIFLEQPAHVGLYSTDCSHGSPPRLDANCTVILAFLLSSFYTPSFCLICYRR